MSRAGGTAGLTLAEVLVVLGLVGLALALALPRMSDAGRAQTALAPGKVAQLVRAVPAMAAARGQPLTVYHDPAGRRVRVKAADGTPLGAPYEVGLPPGLAVSPSGADWFAFDAAGRLVGGGAAVVGSKTINVSRWGEVTLR